MSYGEANCSFGQRNGLRIAEQPGGVSSGNGLLLQNLSKPNQFSMHNGCTNSLSRSWKDVHASFKICAPFTFSCFLFGGAFVAYFSAYAWISHCDVLVFVSIEQYFQLKLFYFGKLFLKC